MKKSIVSVNDVSGLALLEVDNCYIIARFALFMKTAHAKLNVPKHANE